MYLMEMLDFSKVIYLFFWSLNELNIRSLCHKPSPSGTDRSRVPGEQNGHSPASAGLSYVVGTAAGQPAASWL